MRVGLLVCSNREDAEGEGWLSVSARCVIKALERLGHNVSIIWATQIKNEHEKLLLPDGRALEDLHLDGVIARWSAKREHILAIQAYLEQHGVIPATSVEVFRRIEGKLAGARALRTARVAIPKSVLVERHLPYKEEIERALGNAPYVVKGNRGTQGKQVFVVYNVKAALTKVQDLIEEGGQDGAIVEEFIPPPGMSKHECFPQQGIPRVQPEYYRSLVIGGEIHSTLHWKIPPGMTAWVGNRVDEARAELVELLEHQKTIVKQATQVFGFQEAGVDFMLQDSKNVVVLEVNHSPDLEEHMLLGANPGDQIAYNFTEHIRRTRA